jgi:hypothetical protein
MPIAKRKSVDYRQALQAAARIPCQQVLQLGLQALVPRRGLLAQPTHHYHQVRRHDETLGFPQPAAMKGVKPQLDVPLVVASTPDLLQFRMQLGGASVTITLDGIEPHLQPCCAACEHNLPRWLQTSGAACLGSHVPAALV